MSHASKEVKPSTNHQQPTVGGSENAEQSENPQAFDFTPANVLKLQRAIGNRAVQRLLTKQTPADRTLPVNSMIHRESAARGLAALPEEERARWYSRMDEDVEHLLQLSELLDTPLGVPSVGKRTASKIVIDIFSKWQSLDQEHGFNHLLLMRFGERVSKKTLTIHKLLVVEELTNLLDHIKRNLDENSLVKLNQILQPVGLDNAAPELVGFTDTLGETTKEFGLGLPYFLLGILEGIGESLEDLLEMLFELTKLAILQYINPMMVAEQITQYAVDLWKSIREADLKEMGEVLLAEWTQKDIKKRSEFQGRVIGYILTEIALTALTGGGKAATTAAKTAQSIEKASKFAKLTAKFRKLEKMAEMAKKAKPVAEAAKKGVKGVGKTLDAAGTVMDSAGNALEESAEDAAEESGLYWEAVTYDLSEETADTVQRLQRMPLQRNPHTLDGKAPTVPTGDEGEAVIKRALREGRVPGLPKMDHVLGGQYDSVHGQDIFAFCYGSDNKLYLYRIEVKGGVHVGLGRSKRGPQTGKGWTEDVIKKALKQNPQLNARLKKVTGIQSDEKLFKRLIKGRSNIVMSGNIPQKYVNALLKDLKAIPLKSRPIPRRYHK